MKKQLKIEFTHKQKPSVSLMFVKDSCAVNWTALYMADGEVMIEEKGITTGALMTATKRLKDTCEYDADYWLADEDGWIKGVYYTADYFKDRQYSADEVENSIYISSMNNRKEIQ